MADDDGFLIYESQRIIAAWEKVGIPGGHAEDNLRIISEHLMELAEISRARPDLSRPIGTLMVRYRALANRIRTPRSEVSPDQG